MEPPPPLPPKVPKRITMINISSVLATFSKRMIDIINIFAVLSTFAPKGLETR